MRHQGNPIVLSLALSLAGTFTLAAAAPAFAQGAAASAAARSSSTSLIESDRDFLIQTGIDGAAEVEMAKLAQQRGSSPKVKEFASHMIQDHGKANAELKALAASKGVSVPEVLPATKQDDLNLMGKLSGADFDKSYALHMVGDHQKAVASFSKQAQSGGDAQVKAWAAKTLPTLQSHLTSAQALDPAAAPKK